MQQNTKATENWDKERTRSAPRNHGSCCGNKTQCPPKGKSEGGGPLAHLRASTVTGKDGQCSDHCKLYDLELLLSHNSGDNAAKAFPDCTGSFSQGCAKLPDRSRLKKTRFLPAHGVMQRKPRSEGMTTQHLPLG